MYGVPLYFYGLKLARLTLGRRLVKGDKELGGSFDELLVAIVA